MFSPYAQLRMHALKGLACHSRVTTASSHASPCSGEVLTSAACHTFGCTSPFRACSWSMPYGENKWCQRYSPMSATHTTRYVSFGPTAQCVVHVLKGLACRARVTPASSPASHCKQCSASTSPALYARGCTSPSCACRGHKNHHICSRGPKRRYPAVPM